MMKRIISLLLVLVMVLIPLSACKTEEKPADKVEETKTEEKKEEAVEDKKEEKAEDAKEEAKDDAKAAEGKIAKIGLGLVSTSAKSKEGAEWKGPVAQADTTLAAVGFDADGKIVSVTVDVAQTKVEYDEEGKFAKEVVADAQSKKERGAEYGMKDTSEIKKEWDEQMASFEEWMIGKTADEVMGIKVKERDAGHKSVPDIPDLTSSVTISVESYQAAVKEAWDNSIEVKDAEKVGLGVVTSTMRSKELVEGKGIAPHINTTAAVVALNAEGKVVKAIVDVVQNQVKFDDNGKLEAELPAEDKSKLDLGDEYGMKDISEIKKEWHE